MEESYKEMEGMSQSLLKKILTHPSTFLKEKERRKSGKESIGDHYIYGSLVDFLLVRSVDFYDEYYIMKESDLEPAIKPIIEYVFEYVKTMRFRWWSLTMLDLEKIILEGCKLHNWQPRYKDETKIAKIQEKGKTYFESLVASTGKTIITQEEYDCALINKMSLQADPILAKYLTKTSDNEILRGKVIKFNFQGVDMKGELDKVYIDHKEKTIEPLDYKTTDMLVYTFDYNFWKLRYDFQGAVYTTGLREDPEIKKLLNVGYEMLPFKFILMDKQSRNKPLMYELTSASFKIGINGGTRWDSPKYYEGFKQAIQRFKWHTENNKWDFPMEYYINGGKLKI